MWCKGHRSCASRTRHANDQNYRFGSAIVRLFFPSQRSLTNLARGGESSTSIREVLDKCVSQVRRLRSAAMANKLSLRALWKIYKRTGVVTGAGGKRDLAITQLAFYSGARGVLRVLAHLIEQGQYDELHETIRRHGRLIERIQGRRLRAKRH